MATRKDLDQQVYKRFMDAVDLIAHKGYSINRATKEVGMSKNTFRAMNKERGNLVSSVYGINKKGETKRIGYEVDERLGYATNMPAIVFDSNGEATNIIADYDKYYAGILGSYWNQIGNLLEGKISDFSSLPDVIYDRSGNAYTLVKDVDTLLFFLQMQTDEYMTEIWKQFHSEKRKAA